MRYREKFNIQGRKLEYIGTYIPLYGLTDMIIDFYYEELLANNYLSTAAAIAGTSNERAYGKVDKKLRCIAETAEGRKILSNFTYWGNSFHHAAKGHSRLAPDWYINPKGPDGYIVRDKIYSRYLYEPLSKEEFYKRNVGKGIPPGPSPFQSVFTGVGNIFTKALGLQRLLPTDKVKEIIPVKEKVDLGLFSELDTFDSGDEFEDAPEDTSQRDYREIVGSMPPGDYVPVTSYPPVVVGSYIPQPPPKASAKELEETLQAVPQERATTEEAGKSKPIQAAQPEISPAEKAKIDSILSSNTTKMKNTKVPGNEDNIELIMPVGRKKGELVIPRYNKEGELKNYTSTRPDDPEDLEALESHRAFGARYLTREMKKLDKSGATDLTRFAEELNVEFNPRLAYEAKKAALKFELV